MGTSLKTYSPLLLVRVRHRKYSFRTVGGKRATSVSVNGPSLGQFGFGRLCPSLEPRKRKTSIANKGEP